MAVVILLVYGIMPAVIKSGGCAMPAPSVPLTSEASVSREHRETMMGACVP